MKFLLSMENHQQSFFFFFSLCKIRLLSVSFVKIQICSALRLVMTILVTVITLNLQLIECGITSGRVLIIVSCIPVAVKIQVSTASSPQSSTPATTSVGSSPR
ncbi:hypothetical protein ACOSQ4_004651 [Xanthoceras sorbifolium]